MTSSENEHENLPPDEGRQQDQDRRDVWIQLSDRELATVLAALRYHQDENLQGGGEIPDAWIRQIATDGGTLVPLDYDQVSALCERINEEE